MKVIKWILLIFCIMNCLFLDYVLFFQKNSNGNVVQPSNDILDLIELVILFINFLFVIWIYFRDEKKAEKKELTEKKSFWYHDVLIQNNIAQIQEFFVNCINIKEEMKNEKSTDGTKLIIRKVKDQKKNIDSTFGYMLNAYDEELYQSFNKFLLDIEDVVTINLIKVSLEQMSDEDYVKSIKEHEVKVMQLLMEYDIGKK